MRHEDEVATSTIKAKDTTSSCKVILSSIKAAISKVGTCYLVAVILSITPT